MNIRHQISKRPWILAVLVVMIAAAWMYSGTFQPENIPVSTRVGSNADGSNEIARVQVRRQNAQSVVRYINIYGQTEPARTVDLSAETEGRVEKIGARRGTQIKRGEIILQLDLRDRKARVEQSRASLTQHQTAYGAQLELKSQNYVSETQITETLAKLETARADLLRAELDLEYMVIRAPFDGVLQDRDVEIGDFVRAGDMVATFVDNTSVIVSGTIAEQEARFVTVNEVGEATLATGQKISGRIRYISAVADQSTRTFNVELEVPNPDGSLPAGVTAEMRLPGGTTMAQRISPSLLTLDADGIVGIKIVDDYNRVEFFPIELAVSDSDGVWVSGLPDTASIIIVGQGYVSTGQEVDPSVEPEDTALAESAPAAEQMR
jgi:multidrug efflux system membrane fusion protein